MRPGVPRRAPDCGPVFPLSSLPRRTRAQRLRLEGFLRSASRRKFCSTREHMSGEEEADEDALASGHAWFVPVIVSEPRVDTDKGEHILLFLIYSASFVIPKRSILPGFAALPFSYVRLPREAPSQDGNNSKDAGPLSVPGKRKEPEASQEQC